MAIVVQKFGGSSLADVECIGLVADLVAKTRALGPKLIVVVSAMGKTTETLLDLGRRVANPDARRVPNAGALPRRELDMLVSSGERVSTALLSIALHASGVDAVSLTGSQAGIITSTLHFDARIQEIRRDRILSELANHDVVVVAGYQGVSSEREITTLGRGGSDTTAVALAAAFGALRCEIYSDVDGVYSADPNRVGNARHLPRLDYGTLQEMADAGAKVINPRAVGWGREHGVPIHARRTRDFALAESGRETRIVAGEPGPERAVVVNRSLAVLSSPARARNELLSAARELELEVRDVIGAEGRLLATVPLASVPDFSLARERLHQRLSDTCRVSTDFAELSVIGDALDSPSASTSALAACSEAPLTWLSRPRRLTALVKSGAVDVAERRWHELFVER